MLDEQVQRHQRHAKGSFRRLHRPGLWPRRSEPNDAREAFADEWVNARGELSDGWLNPALAVRAPWPVRLRQVTGRDARGLVRTASLRQAGAVPFRRVSGTSARVPLAA